MACDENADIGLDTVVVAVVVDLACGKPVDLGQRTDWIESWRG